MSGLIEKAHPSVRMAILNHGFNVKSFSESHNLNYHLVYNRVKYGWPLSDLDKENGFEPFEYKGVVYKSKMHAWECLAVNVDYNTFIARLARGCDKSFALGLSKSNKKNEPVFAFGKMYDSLSDVANKYGVKESSLKYRMKKHGLSLEDALLYKNKSGRYSIKHLSSNVRLGKKSAQLYLVKIDFDKMPLYKLGVTTKGVKQRFSTLKFNYSDIFVFDGTLYECCMYEEGLLKKLSKYKVRADEDFCGKTECFSLTDDLLLKLLRILRDL